MDQQIRCVEFSRHIDVQQKTEEIYMSKKSKRMRARYKTSPVSNTYNNEKKSATVLDVKTVSSISQRGLVPNQDLQYKYIVPELVRICIIAGIFFIIIIVLSFILK